MLINDGGRFRSKLTEAEQLAYAVDSWSSLSAEEKSVVESILEDLGKSGDSILKKNLDDSVFKMKPVSMDVFLSDPYFLGSSCKTLFPRLRESLIEVFNGQYTTVFWGGSLSMGKTTGGVIAILRMVYELSCLREAHAAYGISKSDAISIAAVSVTEDIAERNILEKVRSFISDSPYFSREFAPIKNTTGSGILFPNKILIPPGASTESGVLGTNAIGAFIDEGNFFNARKSNNQDNSSKNKSNIEIIYEGLKRRIESRFANKGKLPGLLVVGSSKRSLDSFTERELAQSMDRSDVYCLEAAVWEMQPEGRYGKERFRVALGSDTILSRILVDGEPEPEGTEVIEVPFEFYNSFEKDLDQSIRDLAGRATVSVTPFISRREKIYEAIDKTRQHPFSQETWDMSYPGHIKWDLLCKRRLDGTWEPLRNPQAPRHVSLDLSKNQDCTGFSVSHISGYIPVQKMGSDVTEMAPVIDFDFMLQIRAPRAGEIIYAEIRKLIYEFSQHGFYIKLVTADQFQALSLLQTMRSQGYLTKQVSVEPPGGPYESFKLALYENRIKMYNYPPVIKELRSLQKNWKTGRVDHTDTSTKDISDTLAANVATLTAAAYGIKDEFLVSSHDEAMHDEEQTWVLDDARTIVVENDQGGSGNGPAWREHAERELSQEQKSDWRNNFQMPFGMG